MKKIAFISVVIVLLLTTIGCSKKEVSIEEVDYKYVEKNLGDENFVLVDARHNSYYIGNTNNITKNGGHITGAVDFSANWLEVKGASDELKVAMESKNIIKDKEVVVYDSNGTDAKKVAQYFINNGISNVKIFAAKEYINGNANKLTKYKNYEYFIPAYGVNELLDGNDYQGINASKAKFFEVSWGEEDVTYANGHVPTSVHINTDEIESAPLWSLNSDEKLIKFLANNGVNKNDTLILSGSGGHMAVSRLAIIFRYLGVDDVYILNGGNEAFEDAGYDLEKKSNKKNAIDKSDITKPLHPELIDTIEEAEEIIATDNSVLLDVRTKDEWLGKASGYSDLKNRGRIKGAVFHGGTKGETSGDVLDYVNVDGTMRNFDEVIKMWEDAGVDPKSHLSFYCGSGWRTAEILMYGNTYGLNNLSMYSNGWYEWSNYNNEKIETGK
ncbi:MAG: sulfurtransferase [Bacilli bacterium]